MSSYRTILLELRDDGPGNDARVRAACTLARQLDAAILVGLHVVTLPVVAAGFGSASVHIEAEVIEAQRAANRAIQARVRESFARARDPALPVRELLAEDLAGTALSDAARTADLTLLGPAWVGGVAVPMPQPVDEVLIQAGGPVIVLPEKGSVLPAARAVVAWNGSRQAARAMKDALPLLRLAEGGVVVLALGDGTGDDSLEAAVGMLARHGVKARAERRPEQGGTGRALLAAAGELGAGLLVMGAYSHSRLRQAVLGGATREILHAAADLPVLFSY